MKSRAKFAIPKEFEKVIEILDKEVSLVVMRDVFTALYPELAELGERIRKCAICASAFWAKRTDSMTCCAVCLNTFNVRRFRQKEAQKVISL